MNESEDFANISKLLESYKRVKFLQNFDTSLIEKVKKIKPRNSFNIIPAVYQKNQSVVQFKIDNLTNKHIKLQGVTKTSLKKKEETERSRSRNTIFSPSIPFIYDNFTYVSLFQDKNIRIDKSIEGSTPPVGKYTPIYSQIVASPWWNIKYNQRSTKNSKRHPFNSLIGENKAQDKNNLISQEWERCASNLSKCKLLYNSKIKIMKQKQKK